MSLLFDENLSPRLTRLLEAAFPQSDHVERVGLKGQSDLELWEYAARHGATLVSKDNDFRQLSFLRGQPSCLGPADAGAGLTLAGSAEVVFRTRGQVLNSCIAWRGAGAYGR